MASPRTSLPIFVGALLLLVFKALAADGASRHPRVALYPRASQGMAAAGGRLRVDSNLVLIPVSVTDPRNRLVTGLDPRQFRVFEGKAEQKVLDCSNDDAPLSVGIVFDSSGSMARKLAKAREAVAQFL